MEDCLGERHSSLLIIWPEGSRKRRSEMNICTFAAIYIGSYEVSLKVFEIVPKKKIREIDYVRSRLELGRDAYTKGSIGYEMVESLCEVLGKFKKIMDTYGVDAYRAYAASVLRGIKNEVFILDQIKIRTGLDVHVLSNSEHRFISYKSVAMRDEFEKLIERGTAVVDIGGGGMQITVFSGGRVVTTEHLALGTMRMREQLEGKSRNLAQYELQIEELVIKELEVFKSMYLEKIQIENLIILGDYISEIEKHFKKREDSLTIPVKEFVKYVEKLSKRNLEQIAGELNLANEHDAFIIPYIMIFKCMAKSLEAKNIWIPGGNINEGIVSDYAEKHNFMTAVHDFDADIISAAEMLSKRYMSYSPHIDALTQMSKLIFDAMKKIHGLGKRERLLLQVAAILHDCGKYVSIANAAQCSYDIIMSSEIIGLTHLEREIVACTVLFNTRWLSDYEELADRLDEKSYLTVAKLSAILRVSNAMDRSHKQKFKNIKVAIKEKELVITIETLDDIALEKTLFENKTAYFENIFSMKPVIKEKRVYLEK